MRSEGSELGSRTDEDELRRGIAELAAEVRETAEATDPASVRKRARALWGIARRLMKLEEYSEAVSRYQEAEVLLWGLGTEFECELAVSAAGRRAAALLRLKRYRGAADAIDELVGRVDLNWAGSDASGLTADLVPIAVGPWTWLLEQIGDLDRAHAAADMLIAAYDPPSTDLRRLVVASAFQTKGNVAQAHGDDNGALSSFADAIRHSSGSTDPGLLDVFADATYKRGTLLQHSGRGDEAFAAYEAVVANCDGATAPSTRQTLRKARSAKAKLSRPKGWRRGLRP
jgi:tetratricopeptide (TPR) repeat protein